MVTNHQITGTLKPFEFDYSANRRTVLPIFIKGYKITGFVAIESYRGRYRVTCTKMELIKKENPVPDEPEPNIHLEKYALENGTNKIKPLFEKSIGKVLENTFVNMFSF